MLTGVVILGSTGSIGTQTLEVLQNLNNKGYEYRLIGLSANTRWRELKEQKEKYQPEKAIITGLEDSPARGLEAGWDPLLELISREDVDIVINGLVGISGLKPSLLALKAGKKLALANKESLVTGGPLIQQEINKEGTGDIIPVDSEHSAIYQLLEGVSPAEVSSLVLTASGGPFFHTPASEFKKVTPEKALKHPTWSMGGKITIDSATMVNKALEVIEAHWLFGIDYDRIEVIIHTESIIHSLVRLKDGVLLAHMGEPDMKVPIQYALTGGDHEEGNYSDLDLGEMSRLNFYHPRWDDFPALNLGYRAGQIGKSMPVVFNGANEEAVAAFLEKKISFPDIASLIEKVMEAHIPFPLEDLEGVLAADKWARKKFAEEVG